MCLISGNLRGIALERLGGSSSRPRTTTIVTLWSRVNILGTATSKLRQPQSFLIEKPPSELNFPGQWRSRHRFWAGFHWTHEANLTLHSKSPLPAPGLAKVPSSIATSQISTPTGSFGNGVSRDRERRCSTPFPPYGEVNAPLQHGPRKSVLDTLRFRRERTRCKHANQGCCRAACSVSTSQCRI
jgi:hypothetical protein